MINANTTLDNLLKAKAGGIPGLVIDGINADLSGVKSSVTVNLSRGIAQSGRQSQRLPGDVTNVFGASASNKIFGDSRDNILLAGGGNAADKIEGRGGNDMLFSYGGDDVLKGGAGDDLLVGSDGNDVMTGGAGADNFLYTSIATGRDRITDFDASEGDEIYIVARTFKGGLAFGDLAASQFVLGSAARDRDDRFIYNRNSGVLFFDADGTGSKGQIALAKLDDSPTLRASDFVLS